MSRRNILEDSDSDDDDGAQPPPAIDGFFTDKENEAVERCNIRLNDDGGRYSEDEMSRAIASLGEPPLEAAPGGGPLPHERYCVKKGEEKGFFQRDVYAAHDPAAGGGRGASPSEEAILLEIEAIRRSEKAIKNRMFKSGGTVVFGPWWNYSLRRLAELSSGDDGKGLTAKTSGEYTAVKMLRALFGLITEDKVIKAGKLGLLKKKMGVDWEHNCETARNVMDGCCGGSSHFLDGELSAVEAHVRGLKGGTAAAPSPAAVSGGAKSPPSTTAAASAASGTTSSSGKAQVDAAADMAEKRKRLQKARTEKMRADARSSAGGWGRDRGSSSSVDAAGGAASNMAPSAAAAAAAAASPSFSRGSSGRQEAPRDGDNGGRGQARKPPPERAVSQGSGGEAPRRGDGGGGRGQAGNPPAAARSASSGGRRSDAPGGSDDGWGVRRDQDAPPRTFMKPRGVWKFARRTLSSNIAVVENDGGARAQLARDDRRPPAAPRESDPRPGGGGADECERDVGVRDKYVVDRRMGKTIYPEGTAHLKGLAKADTEYYTEDKVVERKFGTRFYPEDEAVVHSSHVDTVSVSSKLVAHGDSHFGVYLKETVVGLVVKDVVPGSAGAEAGIMIGDVVNKVDDLEVYSLDDWRRAIGRKSAVAISYRSKQLGRNFRKTLTH